GQVYPPRPVTNSTDFAMEFTRLNRGAAGMIVVDTERLGGVGVLIEAELFTGAFQLMGAIATINQAAANYHLLHAPDPWPAYTYVPSWAAVNDTLPSSGLLSIHLTPLSGGTLVPSMELVIENRNGESLIVYLPEKTSVDASQGVRVFVAADGSTYDDPGD